jgi:hypothetical protein
MSGLILNEDAIAQAIRAEDDADRARFRDLQQAQIERLRSELAAERTAKLEAESLTGKYANLIGQQREELRTFRGQNATPPAGCAFHTTILGDAEVLVEYEFEPESGDGFNEPHESASVTVLQLLINGKWCDAEDILSADRIEKIAVDIAVARAEDAEADEQDAREANREWSQA